jgi:large subunit ribosomal protein L3
MVSTILGFKIKQSQEFDAAGMRMPVTYVEAGPCYVTKTDAGKTSNSIQIGFAIKKHITKAESGHLKKAGLTNKLRFLRSFKVADLTDLAPGKEITGAEIFKEGDKIQVTGTSKGKGFAGVVKRHNFKGGPRTHGQSDRERSPGSIGQTTTPGRVYRGKRMAGRMGGDRVTVKGLTVVGFDPATNILKIKGVIPGPSNGLVVLTKV